VVVDQRRIWPLTWDSGVVPEGHGNPAIVTIHLDRKPIPVAIAIAPSSVWVLTYEGTLTCVT